METVIVEKKITRQDRRDKAEQLFAKFLLDEEVDRVDLKNAMLLAVADMRIVGEIEKLTRERKE